MLPGQERWSGRPTGIVVIGVSGSGKSTLGACLAARLECAFLEGDDFHSEANVAKMRAGHPLNDGDRWPWLDRLGGAIGAAVQQDGVAIASCSALKAVYRERLAAAADVPLMFVLLDADRETLKARLLGRPSHYMPASLLDSQLATLERPSSDEPATAFVSTVRPDELCADVLAWARTAAA